MDNILISFNVASSRDVYAKVDLIPVVFIGNDIGLACVVVIALAEHNGQMCSYTMIEGSYEPTKRLP